MNKLPLLSAVLIWAGIDTAKAQLAETATSALACQQNVSIPSHSSRLIGVNLVRPVLAGGIISASAAHQLTDQQVNFTTALAGQSQLWVEITSGAHRGIASLVATVTTNTLTTEDDLSAFSAAGDTYAVRAMHTVTSLFGAANEAGLRSSPNTNGGGNPDLIRIPDGAGGFRQIYYSTSAGDWREIGASSSAANIPIHHVDGFYIARNGSTDLNLTFTGLLHATPVYHAVNTGVTVPLNTVYPTSATLGNSGLAAQLLAGSETTADVISLQTANGTLENYYHNGSGWRKFGDPSTDHADTPLSTAFLLQRRGPSVNLKRTPPPSYVGL